MSLYLLVLLEFC